MHTDHMLPEIRTDLNRVDELVDQFFCEEQLIDSQFVRLDTLEEVERLLVSWGLDSAVFKAPWKNDWPL